VTRTVRRFVAAACAASVALGLAAPAAHAAGIVTLARSPDRVHSFGFDGGRIAYDTVPCGFGALPTPFHVLRIGAGDQTFGQHGGGCVEVAIGGKRVIWDVAVDGEAFISSIWTVATDNPRPAKLQTLSSEAVPGALVGPMAGDRRTLAYAWTTYDFENPTTCEQNGTGCDLVVSGGGVRTVHGRSRTQVPGAPPAAEMAVSRGRIAIVREVVGQPLSTEWNRVRVINAADGSVISNFSTSGSIGSIALAGDQVAVLVRAGGGVKHIEVHDATTGALERSLPIASDAVGPIDMSAKSGILFRRGRVLIRASADGSFRGPLVVIRGKFVGFGIEGTRVAWAENRNGRGAVRMVSTLR
jgi:hypothetical protein